ncbi:MAG: hypothetical protein KDB27_10235 [Planctomycetales bacterium]|nr:hypothetical protein [Planctomycetales bacterium]
MTSSKHFVRVGVLGHVGRFESSDGAIHPRGRRVICRTRRGLELGEVLSVSTTDDTLSSDGNLLRAVTVEDELLIARMERNRADAYDECVRRLEQRNISVPLMEVEHLFDGQTIYFYFLGEVTPDIELLTSELAEAYETKVQFRDFADAVERGCGPDCGTESAEGCGTGCSSCAVAMACKK